MTACAFISPQGLPALIADTITTFSKPAPTVDNLKNRIELLKILPSVDPRVFDMKVRRQTKLARKIYILNDDAAIAIAGDKDKIVEYLELAKGLIDTFMEYDRPMRKLGDYANQINGAGKTGLEVVGASVGDGGKSSNYMSFMPTKDLTILGKSAVIGSGAGELGTLLRDYNNQIENSWPRPLIVTEVIRGVASGCNNTVLLNERRLGQASSNSWGGFLEYAYYDLEQSRWRRGPKSIHIILHAVDHESTGIVLNLNNKVIAYEPGDKHGCVLSVTLNEGEDTLLHSWLLEDLLCGNSEDIGEMYIDPNYWKNWKCESATITIVPPIGDNSLKIIHKSIELRQVNEIIFDINDDNVRVGISDKLTKELIKYACLHWGIGDQER